MPAGRPTTYDDELLAKAKEYITVYEAQGDMIPSVEGLAAYIERARSTLYDWASQDDKAEFSDILSEINETQKRVLVNKGLSNDFNSNITKLVLGKHGLSDKTEQEISGPDKGPIQTTSVINFIPVSRKDKDDK